MKKNSPFGMIQPGRKYSVDNYRYGFNGKENDNEVKDEGNQQDYGMRIYDPRLGRFLSVDPISREYPELTPYQFASNTPIAGIDLDGLELAAPPGMKASYIDAMGKNQAAQNSPTLTKPSTSTSKTATNNQRSSGMNLGKIQKANSELPPYAYKPKNATPLIDNSNKKKNLVSESLETAATVAEGGELFAEKIADDTKLAKNFKIVGNTYNTVKIGIHVITEDAEGLGEDMKEIALAKVAAKTVGAELYYAGKLFTAWYNSDETQAQMYKAFEGYRNDNMRQRDKFKMSEPEWKDYNDIVVKYGTIMYEIKKKFVEKHIKNRERLGDDR